MNMRTKFLSGLLMLFALGAQAQQLTLLIPTNNIPTTTLFLLSVPTVDGTNVTRVTTLSNLMVSMKNLGFTNGNATLQTVNNASNSVITYSDSTLVTASNALVAYVDLIGSVGAIYDLNGKGTNTALFATSAGETNLTLLGAVQQTFLALGHTSSVFRVYTTSGGDGELLLNDESGNAAVRLRSNTGASLLAGAGGTLGVGTVNPQATFHVFSALEPNMIIESQDMDIDHLRVRWTNGFTLAAIDSAGGFGRLLAHSNNLAKVVLSAGSDSYIIGSQFGLGTNSPNHALDVHGAIRAGLAVPGAVAVIGADGTITNAQASIAEANHLVGVTGGIQTNINNRVTANELASATNAIDFLLRAPSVELVSIPNTVLDWATHPRRHMDMTTNVNMSFLNTNVTEGAFIRVRSIGTNHTLDLPDFDIYYGGVQPPEIINTNEVWGFKFGRSGGLMTIAVVSPSVIGAIIVQSNAVDKGTASRLNFVAGSGATVDVVNTDGTNTVTIGATGGGGGEANTMSSAGGISLLRPKSGVDLPIKGFNSAQFLADTNVMHVRNGAAFTNIVSYDDFYAPTKARANDFELATTASRFHWDGGPKLAYVSTSTVALSNSANTALGTLFANLNPGTSGNVQFGASGPKLALESGVLASMDSSGIARQPFVASRFEATAAPGFKFTSGPAITSSGDTIRTSNSVNTANADALFAAVTATALNMTHIDQIFIPASFMISNSTEGATFATAERFSPTNRMDDYYIFADAVTNRLQFKLMFPENWDAGTIKAKFAWESTNGIANQTNVWSIQATAFSHDDTQDGNWGTAQVVASKVTAANDFILSAATPAVTIAGTPANGDMISFRVNRLGASADDAMSGGQSKLQGVWLQYTKTKVGVTAW